MACLPVCPVASLSLSQRGSTVLLSRAVQYWGWSLLPASLYAHILSFLFLLPLSLVPLRLL